MKVNLYVAQPAHSPTIQAMAEMIRRAYAQGKGRAVVQERELKLVQS
jgi:hypothetical protein